MRDTKKQLWKGKHVSQHLIKAPFMTETDNILNYSLTFKLPITTIVVCWVIDLLVIFKVIFANSVDSLVVH